MWEGKINETYLREWVGSESKANIVIIHGVGEHSGRYIKTAQNLFEGGFNIYTGDLIGHGLSDGQRVYISSIQDYMNNVDFFISRIQNDKPLFLLGHGMGGLIVLYYMLFWNKKNIKGVIASSPYIKDKIKIPAVKYFLGKAAGTLFPKLRIESGLKGEMVCRDKEVAHKYDEDRLNCSKVTAKWFVEIEKARYKLVQQWASFDSPCLILQAGEDLAVDAEGVRRFYQEIKSVDKEFVLYKDFYHEILNDPERSKVIDKINSWINERVE
jgi:alpha-beta hydrolase superfamily lysophospholipase